MPSLTLSGAQVDLVALPSDRRIFPEGIAGTEKTTAGVARLTGQSPSFGLIAAPCKTRTVDSASKTRIDLPAEV
jgi:hypothetical protein